MRFHYPNILDVVETVSVGTSIIQNTLGEFSYEMRFLPAIKFERSILNIVFAGRPPLYFLFFSVMLATTAYYMARIAQKKAQHAIITFFGIFLLYISPVTVDAYWRLGTAETLFTLLLVFSTYLLMYRRYGFTIVSLIGLMMTKETAVLYIPIYLGVFLMQKQYRAFFLLAALYGGFCIKVYQLVRYATSYNVYTSMVTTTIHSGMEMISHVADLHAFYLLIFWGTGILFLYRMIATRHNGSPKQPEWGYLFFAISAIGLCTLIVFHNPYQSYYAFPTVVAIILWMMYELEHVHRLYAHGVMVCIFLLFFLMRIPGQTMLQMEYWQNDYAGDNALIDVVLKNTSTRYVLMRDYRPEYPIGLTYLMGDRSHAAVTDTIFLIAKEREYPEATLLCSPTLFQQRDCKWGVIHHE